MILQNNSASPITLAGQYTIPAGSTLTIPYASLENDRSFISYLDNQSLWIVDAEESFTLASIPRFTQGVFVSAQSLTSNQTYIPTANNGTTPITLWVAPFQNVRIYLKVTSGDMQVTLSDSPDGGQTFYPIPDCPSLQASATDANGGMVSALLPSGLCLLRPTLSSVGGGTATISYARQS